MISTVKKFVFLNRLKGIKRQYLELAAAGIFHFWAADGGERVYTVFCEQKEEMKMTHLIKKGVVFNLPMSTITLVEDC